MTDMLVKLYNLAPLAPVRDRLSQKQITVRRAMAYERGVITQWVDQQFGPRWAAECHMAFSRHPVGCHIAVFNSEICGFCCTDSTFRGFLGPIGTHDAYRGRGVGRLLLLTALDAMWHQGYAYAVIGDVGESGFFTRCAGAAAIIESTPGPYPARLNPQGQDLQ